MLKLNLSNENVRELALELVSGNDSEFLTDFDRDTIGNAWTEAALKKIFLDGVDYERSYSQSVGAFVIVQSGSTAEKDAWASALDATRKQFESLAAEMVAEERKYQAENAADNAE